MFIPTVLTMPAHAIVGLLPNPSLLILGFLEFLILLSVILFNSKPRSPSSTYFSSEQPNVEDIQIIKTISILPSDVINMLLRYAATPTSLTAVPIHSVTCAHLTIDFATSYHLPLWIIVYWFEISHLHDTIRPPWVNAEQVLKQWSCLWRKASNPKGSQDLLQQAYMMLGSLPWSGFVLGFKTHEKINHLAAYMTQKWLSDVHEMQMLELLQVTIVNKWPPSRSKLKDHISMAISNQHLKQKNQDTKTQHRLAVHMAWMKPFILVSTQASAS
ncbi:hypothetical protein JVT61DRAFT_7201 [Boletus reticuloceps]|uniref:Uncharacterized protein n=1 Tax=Boletus reticuloceps TaxID=495285 RepID=A0A8I3A665_9AGAM|nr:hypothetical protein JVT61DRAFT_7201 [Boletus reticuloceps]